MAGIVSGIVILMVTIGLFSPEPTPAKSKNMANVYPPTSSYVSAHSIPNPTTVVMPTARPTVSISSVAEGKTGNDFCLNVPVLMYHHIQPEALASEKGQTSLTVDSGIFDQQMAYLVSRGYTSISANQLANALRTHSNLPGKPIVITMDDGYKDNFTYAFPVIQKYGLIANIMIPTGLLENEDFLSWNDLKTMVDSGRFNAYDHTWSHASLGGASDDKVQAEVMTAKTQLEEHLGRPINIFAYPYGSESPRVAQIIAQDGFTAAFSTIAGKTQCESFIMALHRTRIGNSSLSSYGI